MTVIIQGKEYSSVSECARQHNIDPKLLVSRIRCYGQNSNKLFKPVLPAKHSITYKGKKYETLKEFAEAFNLKPSTVHHRWERGIRDPELLKKTVNQSVKENINKFNGKYAHSVTYHGHIFPTLKAMASYYDVPYFRLTSRIARYGIDYPNLLSKQSLRNDKQIIYQDKKYNSIAELAQEFNISPSAFYSRLSSGYSISEALTHDFSRGNKVVFDGKTYPSHNALFKALATPDCSWFVIKQRWRKNIRNKSDLTRPKNAHPDNRYLLGDEGYLGKNLHQRLEQMGYTLWTPYRKNMKNAQKHNKHYLMVLRRTIESDFSLLSYYNAENNRARSLAGFQERLEVAILAYNMAYCLERFN